MAFNSNASIAVILKQCHYCIISNLLKFLNYTIGSFHLWGHNSWYLSSPIPFSFSLIYIDEVCWLNFSWFRDKKKQICLNFMIFQKLLCKFVVFLAQFEYLPCLLSGHICIRKYIRGYGYPIYFDPSDLEGQLVFL